MSVVSTFRRVVSCCHRCLETDDRRDQMLFQREDVRFNVHTLHVRHVHHSGYICRKRDNARGVCFHCHRVRAISHCVAHKTEQPSNLCVPQLASKTMRACSLDTSSTKNMDAKLRTRSVCLQTATSGGTVSVIHREGGRLWNKNRLSL